MNIHKYGVGWWFSLFVAVAFISWGCSHPPKTMSFEEQSKLQGDDWVAIAGIDGGDHELQAVIRDTLKRNGILCFFSGSLAYDVFVPKSLAHDAKRTLEHASQLKGRLIHFADHRPSTM